MLLETCDVIQNGGQDDAIRNKKYEETAELKILHARQVKHDIIKQFAAFVGILYFFPPNKRRKTHNVIQKWLELMVLITSHLETIVTGSSKTAKICVSLKRIAIKRQVVTKSFLKKK